MDLAPIALGVVVGFILGDIVVTTRRTARQVRRIIELEEQQIMNEQDLQNALDGIKATVTSVAQRQAAMAQTISDLQAAQAAGTPVSQEQLDSLVAEANEIAGVLAPLVA